MIFAGLTAVAFSAAHDAGTRKSYPSARRSAADSSQGLRPPGKWRTNASAQALARRDGIPVVRPPFGARNQHGGQIAALTENHILSSCDMLYPTEESSFFSIALVRAAGRKKVADQYVCGSSGNKPGAPYPFDGDRCLPGCLFNASCPSSLELDPYITTQVKSTSRALKPCAVVSRGDK